MYQCVYSKEIQEGRPEAGETDDPQRAGRSEWRWGEENRENPWGE